MEQALKDWFQKVWVDGDLDMIDAFFAPDGHAAGMMTGFEVGPEDFKALVPALRDQLREISVSIERSVQAGDWFCALLRIDAKAAETLEPVQISGQVMMRLGPDGRIAEAYNHFDMLGYFEQMGALPQDTMALCLAGETFA